MMPIVNARCSVFVATSLDGYIARADGRIDWLDDANARLPPGEDCGFSEFFSTVDALVMGRNTFDLARTIDEVTITLIPVLLGSGLPLFGPVARDVRLRPLSSKAYRFEFVQSKYRVEPG